MVEPRALIAAQLAEQATIQTAIVMASTLGLAGQLPGYAKTLRGLASECMLGVFKNPSLHATLACNDVTSFEQREIGNTKNALFRVDCATTPLDGHDSLWKGESGSVSIAAVGEPGCFNKANTYALDQEFFVVAIGAQRLNDDLKGATGIFQNNPPEADTPIKHFVEGVDQNDDYEGVEAINSLLKPEDSDAPQQPVIGKTPPVVAVMFEDPFNKMDLTTKGTCRRRILHGSAFAAALAAFDGKISCSVFVTRRPQLHQVAIAAIGMGGQIFAVPLSSKDSNKGDNLENKKLVGSTWLTADDFVGWDKKSGKETEVLVSATSISEVCALDRVRYSSPNLARTDTITISLPHRTVVRRRSDVVLDENNMLNAKGKPTSSNALIDQLMKELKKKLGPA